MSETMSRSNEPNAVFEIPPPSVTVEEVGVDAGSGPGVGPNLVLTMQADLANSKDRKLEAKGSSLTVNIAKADGSGYFGVLGGTDMKTLIAKLNLLNDNGPAITRGTVLMALTPQPNMDLPPKSVMVTGHFRITDSELQFPPEIEVKQQGIEKVTLLIKDLSILFAKPAPEAEGFAGA